MNAAHAAQAPDLLCVRTSWIGSSCIWAQSAMHDLALLQYAGHAKLNLADV